MKFREIGYKEIGCLGVLLLVFIGVCSGPNSNISHSGEYISDMVTASDNNSNNIPTKYTPTSSANLPISTTEPLRTRGCVKASNLNVRIRPGASYSIIGYLNEANCREFNGRSINNKWLRTESMNWDIVAHGWVSSIYIELEGDISNLKVFGPNPTPTPSLTINPTATITRWPTATGHSKPSDGEGINCHPSYQGACLQMGIGDYDCAGGRGNGPNYVRGPVWVVGPDVFGLDGDGDGIGCE